MAKVKGFNPPETEFAYDDATGDRHYFGEFFRMIFGEGSVSLVDPETDLIGKSRRGERPSQKGDGSKAQGFYRKAFRNCAMLWNSLPEECPDPFVDPPPTSKESVWDAKLEHGVTCTYYDLFMRCCVKWAVAHDGAMPVGDCFPCEDPCSCEYIRLVCESESMFVDESQTVNIGMPVEGCVYDFYIVSGGGSLEGIAGFARTFYAECPVPSGIEALAWDVEGSCDEVAPGNSCEVKVTGGMGPYHWWVTGTGFSLQHEETATGVNTLIASDGCDGTAQIQVKSSCIKDTVIGVKYKEEVCDTISIEVRDEDFETVWGEVECVPECIPDPAMAWDYATSAETIARNNSCTIAITGNNTPFIWSVEGVGFSLTNAETAGLENTLCADGTACGPAKITVTGCDGIVAIGYVRCTTGHWSGNINGCMLSGVPDTIEPSIYGSFLLTKTEGKYKQKQHIGGSHSGTGSCDDFNCMAYCVTGHANCKNCTECLDWSCSDRLAWGGEPGLDCGGWCCIYTFYSCDYNYHFCQCNWGLSYQEWSCS